MLLQYKIDNIKKNDVSKTDDKIDKAAKEYFSMCCNKPLFLPCLINIRILLPFTNPRIMIRTSRGLTVYIVINYSCAVFKSFSKCILFLLVTTVFLYTTVNVISCHHISDF